MGATKQQEYKYLKVCRFKALANWSAASAINADATYNPTFKLEKIGRLLVRNKTRIVIENERSYQRVTIRLYGKGLKQRDIVQGKHIGTKTQFCITQGQFLMSKIDARNGAFGIVPAVLNGAIVTQDFLSYDINTQLIRPAFFIFLITTKHFQNICERASAGTTGRRRVNERLFLNFQLPLPSLFEQDKLVAAYQSNLAAADAKEVAAANTEEEIERYFLEQMGLPAFPSRIATKGFQLIRFADLERWDAYSADNRISMLLKQCPYEIKKLGTVYNFVSRGWNSRRTADATFRYVEIGAIDPSVGIVEAKEVPVAKAPSRASQTILEGDLIIGTTRPYLKKFALVSSAYDEVVASSGFAVIEQSTQYNLAFLRQFLVSKYGIEQLKNKMSGALYPAITDAALREVKIPFPDVAEQQRIMERVEEHRKEINAAQSEAITLKAQAVKEFEVAIFQS